MITADNARKLTIKSLTANWRERRLCKKELRKVNSRIKKSAKKGLRVCYFENLSKNSRKQLEISGFTVQLVAPILQLWEISWND